MWCKQELGGPCAVGFALLNVCHCPEKNLPAGSLVPGGWGVYGAEPPLATYKVMRENLTCLLLYATETLRFFISEQAFEFSTIHLIKPWWLHKSFNLSYLSWFSPWCPPSWHSPGTWFTYCGHSSPSSWGLIWGRMDWNSSSFTSHCLTPFTWEASPARSALKYECVISFLHRSPVSIRCPSILTF